MIKQKRGLGVFTWILIILIALAIGCILTWFFLSGNGSSIINGGNSIPQPPSLPSG
jgi:hypothetical protein